MAVSLVLPCYNPPPGWEQTICAGYNGFCSGTGDMAELVLVLDGAGHTETKTGIRFLQQNITNMRLVAYDENKGKGYAIRQGVKSATGDIVIYTDVDFPYTTASMLAVYEALKNDETDVAVGVKDESYYAHVPRLRRVISRFLRVLIRLFLSMPVTDTQCGLKGFKSSVAPLFLEVTINRYLFDLEFVRNCFKSRKYRVKAIPITLNENIHFRSMDYRILLPEMLNFVRLLFK